MIYRNSNGTGLIKRYQFYIGIPPTATPTATSTATVTATPTATSTKTPVPSATPTPTLTRTPTWGPVFHNDSHSGGGHGHSHSTSGGQFRYVIREAWTSTHGPWQRPRGWSTLTPTSTPKMGVWWHNQAVNVPNRHYHIHEGGSEGRRSSPILPSSFPNRNLGTIGAGAGGIDYYRIMGGNNPIRLMLTQNTGNYVTMDIIPLSEYGRRTVSIRDLRMNIFGYGSRAYNRRDGQLLDFWDQYGYRIDPIQGLRVGCVWNLIIG